MRIRSVTLQENVGGPPREPATLVHPHSKHRESPSHDQALCSFEEEERHKHNAEILTRRHISFFQLLVAFINHLRRATVLGRRSVFEPKYFRSAPPSGHDNHV